jgi:hypothetical protein
MQAIIKSQDKSCTVLVWRSINAAYQERLAILTNDFDPCAFIICRVKIAPNTKLQAIPQVDNSSAARLKTMSIASAIE